MFPSVVAPLVAALILAVVVTAIHRRLPPAMAARVLAVAIAVVVAAALPTEWMVTLGYLAHLPFVGTGFRWCAETFGVHSQVPSWIGMPVALLTILGTARGVGLVRTYRTMRCDRAGAVEILDDDRAFAVTLPGRGGLIVLSSALVAMLDTRETAVVVAHEGAHAQYRHDRYLVMAQVATATVPVLLPLTARLRFSLERWADEVSARECGDRHLVARTLGKVALFRVESLGVMSFAGLGVAARVGALLSPPRRRPPASISAGLWLAISVTALLAGYQLHHLASLIAAACPD